MSFANTTVNPPQAKYEAMLEKCWPAKGFCDSPLLVGAQCVSDQSDGNDKDKNAAEQLLDSISSRPKWCLA